MVRDHVETRASEHGVVLTALRVALTLPPARLSAPLVGRGRELGVLAEAAEIAVRQGARRVTLVGEAGLGKSRLVHELEQLLAGRMRLVRTRCLPYGEGLAYWPAAEIVRQLAGVDESDDADAVAAKLRAALAGESDAPFAVAALRELLGGTAAGATGADIGRAFARMVERAAAERPLVVVIDDLHLGRPTFLELVDRLTDLLGDAPVLVLALARPELADHHPQSARLGYASLIMRLEPLGIDESGQLAAHLLGAAAASAPAGLALAAGGNPLFVEELVRALGDGTSTAADGVPATLAALVAQRIERLASRERAVLARAALVGFDFDPDALAALADDDDERSLVPQLLGRLAAHDLVVPQEAAATRGSLRFRHMIVRDAAYASLPNGLRAELHERFADWLEKAVGDRLPEYEEILAHHLERAAGGQADAGDRADELRARASAHLASAGRRAYSRGDMPSAIRLLDRAVDLAVDEREGLRIAPDLGAALYEAGRLDEARLVLGEGGDAAAELGEEIAVHRATVELGFVRIDLDPDPPTGEILDAAHAAATALEARDEHRAAARAWQLVALVHHHFGRQDPRLQALERAAAAHARANIDDATLLVRMASALCNGPAPLGAGRRRVQNWLLRMRGRPHAEAGLLEYLATFARLMGEPETSADLFERAHRHAEDLRDPVTLWGIAYNKAELGLLCGDPLDEAITQVRSARDALDQLGERNRLSTTIGLEAVLLAEAGLAQEALDAAARSADLGAGDDFLTEAMWRLARSRAGDRDAASLAADAVNLTDRTDFPVWRAESRVAHGQALAAAGDRSAAARLFDEAEWMLEDKEAVAHLRRVRDLRAQLRL